MGSVAEALAFPNGFFWGAATSAHQIEGQNQNSDWWRSEERGLVPHRSGDACGSWRRFADDVRLLQDLGLNAYRFSVEWARIQPEPDRFDQAALDRYRAQIELLRAAGIEPFVTLHHFTNPLWLVDLGGWHSPLVVDRFAAYAGRVSAALGDLVRWWVTINEPNLLANFGYVEGTWPPHRRGDVVGYWRCLENAARAHAAARRALKAQHADAAASIAFAIWPLEPYRPHHPLDRAAARLLDWLSHGRILSSTASSLDWVGLNFYTRVRARWSPRPSRPLPETLQGPGEKTDFGWEIYPEGLYQALWRLASLGKPIVVTENGIADADDDQRPRFIVDYVRQAHRALRDGVDLRGYLHWSLMDNFEWAEGYTKRFGLYAVDFASQRRTPRPSAFLYRDIAQANALTPEVLARHATLLGVSAQRAG